MTIIDIANQIRPSNFRKTIKRIVTSELGLRLVNGIFWSITGAILSRSMMLLASLLMARILGVEKFGEFGMVRSTVAMFASFATFGLGITATKHVAEFRQKDPQRAGRIMALASLFALVTGTLMGSAVFFLAPWLATVTINAPHLTSVLQVTSFTIILSGLNGAQTGALAGLEAFKTIAKVNVSISIVSFPLLLAGAFWWGLHGAIWAGLINVAANWIVSHFALQRESARCAIPFSYRGCSQEWPILWKFAFPAALSGILVTPATWACNALLVNQPGGYIQMGIYDAANQWGAIVLFVPNMAALVVIPMLSSLVGNSEKQSYSKLLKYNVVAVGAFSFITCLPLALASSWIMQFYGKDFENSSSVMVCILFSSSLVSVNNIIGNAIATQNKMWEGLALNIIWAVNLTALSYYFISHGYGAIGLATSYLLSYLFHTLLVSIYTARTLSLKAI